MNKENLINLDMKDVILDKWKSKKGYILNNKDLEELKNIIDYYEQENKELHNKIDKLEDELNWYKQECDDLEMSGGMGE